MQEFLALSLRVFISLSAMNVFIASYALTQEAQSQITEDEALYVRRILEFWRDKEHAIVKSQIRQFIKDNPKSEYIDSLLVILGDTYWNEQNFDEALAAYAMIKGQNFQDKVFNNRLDCLYHLGRHEELLDELRPKDLNENKKPDNFEKALWMFYKAEALLQMAKNNAGEEESRAQYEKARSYFKQLLDTDHQVNAKLALSEIETSLGNASEAAGYYIELSEAIPEKRGELLLQAAQIQAKIDPEQALILYDKIQEYPGEFSSKAALNKLILLFDLGEYQKIIDEKDNLAQVLKMNQKPVLDFYLGRSHFALNQYEEAIVSLRPLLKPANKLPNHDDTIDKAILLTMGASAHHLNDLILLSNLTRRYEENFPQDPSLAKLLYLEALTLNKFDRTYDALSNLQKIAAEYPDFDKKDTVDFEISLILYKQGRWKESRDAFAAVIEKNDGSSMGLAAIQYLPCASLQMLEDAEVAGTPCDELRELLLSDMKKALSTPGAIKPAQKPKYLLKMGKVQYDMQRYQAATNLLKEYIEGYPHDENLFQGHLLLAMCYHEGQRDPQNFAKHAEKVLELKPDFSDQFRLRLNLFSTYLQLAKLAEESKEGESGQAMPNTDKAAGHLYAVMILNHEQIKPENQLWLANYYYDKVKRLANEYVVEPLMSQDQIANAERSMVIYEKALSLVDDSQAIQITPEKMYLEQELFKLSNLYGWLDLPQEQTVLLEQLIKQQNDNPKWAWTLRSRTVFALANAYKSQGKTTQALETYKTLATTVKSSDPFVINASKLQWARLAFDDLPQNKHTIENQEMMAILKALKDLQIRKSLSQEPLHLEAAIDYATIRSSLEPEDKRDEQMRFQLLRVKEDFTSREDLWSKDYYASRLKLPEKDFIYQAYMMLIDAHVARVEARIAEKSGMMPEMEAKNEAALAIYKSLLKGKFAVSKYLVDQAKSGLMDLKQYD